MSIMIMSLRPGLNSHAPDLFRVRLARRTSRSASTLSSAHERKPALTIAAAVALSNRDVALEACNFLGVDVLADFFAELFDCSVRPIFLELAQHPRPHPGNTEKILIAGAVEIDRYEHILLQPRDFFLIDVLADLTPELGERGVGTILLEFVRDARANARHKENLLARGAVEIEGKEQARIQLARLLGRQGRRQQGMKLRHRLEGATRHDALHCRFGQMR